MIVVWSRVEAGGRPDGRFRRQTKENRLNRRDGEVKPLKQKKTVGKTSSSVYNGTFFCSGRGQSCVFAACVSFELQRPTGSCDSNLSYIPAASS